MSESWLNDCETSSFSTGKILIREGPCLDGWSLESMRLYCTGRIYLFVTSITFFQPLKLPFFFSPLVRWYDHISLFFTPKKQNFFCLQKSTKIVAICWRLEPSKSIALSSKSDQKRNHALIFGNPTHFRQSHPPTPGRNFYDGQTPVWFPVYQREVKWYPPKGSSIIPCDHFCPKGTYQKG